MYAHSLEVSCLVCRKYLEVFFKTEHLFSETPIIFSAVKVLDWFNDTFIIQIVVFSIFGNHLLFSYVTDDILPVCKFLFCCYWMYQCNVTVCCVCSCKIITRIMWLFVSNSFPFFAIHFVPYINISVIRSWFLLLDFTFLLEIHFVVTKWLLRDYHGLHSVVVCIKQVMVFTAYD